MRLLLLALAIVGALYTLLTSITLVQPGERAVIRRFGRILDEKPGPGLHVGLPWGMDRVDPVAVGRLRRIKVGAATSSGEPQAPASEDDSLPVGQLLTGDHNLVNVQATIDYRALEGEVERFALLQNQADDLITSAAEASLAQWTAGRGIDEILLRGKILLPVWLVRDVQERIDRFGVGVKIEDASIIELLAPAEVRASFGEVGKEQQRIDTRVNQATQEANRKLREAASEKLRIESETRRYAREQESQARSDAENFLKRLEQYRRLARDNPDYLNVMWTDSMTRLYARMRETGRIDVLDHYLSGEGLNITQFPLLPRKK
jgi:membrane protease subunit HflK